MPNKRQRVAKRGWAEANEDQLSGQKRAREDEEGKDKPPTKKKLKKEAWKQRMAEKRAAKGKKLRQESRGRRCRLCGNGGHLAKDCPDKPSRHKICLMCRKKGHTVKECPQKGESNEGLAENMCYNCGDRGHRLADCPQPRANGAMPFAVCFICKERGHLSAACPANEHGIYIKGGSCKYCKSVRHLAKDCPENPRGGGRQQHRLQIGNGGVAGNRPNKRVVFDSGDALDDDFGEDVDPGDADIDKQIDIGDTGGEVGTAGSKKASKVKGAGKLARTPKSRSKVVTF